MSETWLPMAIPTIYVSKYKYMRSKKWNKMQTCIFL